MATRASTRQRYPEHTKPLKVIKSYEKYALFEASFADITRLNESSDNTMRRVEELKQESTKTLEALKQKQPVRIPEVKSTEDTNHGCATNGKEVVEEIEQKPLKKKAMKRPNYLIRHITKKEDEEDTRYNYGATQDDLQFITELKGSPFTMLEFERLINLFEGEDNEYDQVKPFDAFLEPISRLGMKQSRDDIAKIYEVEWA